MPSTPLAISVRPGCSVSGLLRTPSDVPRAALVLAHGAGAGMAHPFMAAVSDGLADRGIATLRFNFPFAETGAKRPDPPALAHEAIRAAVEEARRHLPEVPLFAGGKSFGARMTSQAQAAAALPDVRGLVFLGFPLHPAKKPSTTRAAHLDDVRIPLLFVQGTRDALANGDLVGGVVDRLGAGATLFVAEGADHGFHVPKRSGRTDEEAMDSILDAVAGWLGERLAAGRPTGAS